MPTFVIHSFSMWFLIYKKKKKKKRLTDFENKLLVNNLKARTVPVSLETTQTQQYYFCMCKDYSVEIVITDH